MLKTKKQLHKRIKDLEVKNAHLELEKAVVEKDLKAANIELEIKTLYLQQAADIIEYLDRESKKMKKEFLKMVSQMRISIIEENEEEDKDEI